MKRLLIPVFFFGVAVVFFLSCQKELSQESNINNATFSLLDDSSNCLSTPAVNGDYYNGVAARDVNFVTVVVNVKTTGNYSISTISENGFYFADSGFFSSVGFDTLVLKMKGTPTLIKTTDFSFSDSNTCSFVVDVQDSTGTGLGGVDTSGDSAESDSSYIDPQPATTNTWHFTDTATGVTYNGIFTPLTGAGFRNDTLFVAGQAVSTADTGFGVTIKIPSLTIAKGIYPVNASNSIVLQTVIDQDDFYAANDITAAEGEGNSYITITNYSNNQLSASFHAYAEFNGNPTLIVGSFNCPVH